MSLFGFLKNKKVPDELPDLATDELGKDVDRRLEDDKDIIEEHLKQESSFGGFGGKEEKDNLVQTNKKKEADNISEDHESKKSRKSFFNDLEKHISSEIDDLDKLEDWYENKFLPQDVVGGMREYWESQKNNSVLEVLGKNFKQRINEKTKELQEREREWQNIYFDLVEKEEEIRDSEQELKSILAEFVEICKRKKKNFGKLDNEQKKTKEKKNKKSS